MRASCALVCALLVSLLAPGARAQVSSPTWINEDGSAEKPEEPESDTSPRPPTPPAGRVQGGSDRPQQGGPAANPGPDRRPSPPATSPKPARPSKPVKPAKPGPGDSPGEDGEGSDAAAESLSGFGRIEESADAYAKILLAWEARRKALRSHRAVEANKHLMAVTEEIKKLGGGGPLQTSLRDIGATLCREALRALEEKDALRALGLAEIATDVAPDVPLTHFTLARTRFAHKPGNVVGVVNAARAGVFAALAELSTLASILLSVIFFALLALLAAILIVALSLFLRASRLLVHDTRHLMPRGVSTLQAASLVVVLAVLPLLFKLGPQLLALWLLILIWAYLSKRERGAVAALWLLTLLVPILVMAGARFMGADTRETAQIYRATRDLGMRDARAVLERNLAERSDDPSLLGAMAVLEKRDGRLASARSYLTRAIAVDPEAAWLRNNMGNIRVLEGDLDGAISEYKRAVDRDPAFIEAHFNIANLYFRTKRLSQGRSAASTAMTIDEATFNRYQRLTEVAGASHNQTVVDVNLPALALWETALRSGRDAERFERQAADLLFFGLPPPLMAAAVVAGFLLLLAWGRVLSRLRPSHACPRCGHAACVRCDEDIPTHDVCGQCYHAFLAPSRSIDANLKIRKEIEVRRYRSRRDTMRRFLGLVVAGLGHLVGGAPIRGVVAVVLFAMLLAAVPFIWGVVPAPFAFGSTLPLGRILVLVVLFAVLYLWSFLSVSRMEG